MVRIQTTSTLNLNLARDYKVKCASGSVRRGTNSHIVEVCACITLSTITGQLMEQPEIPAFIREERRRKATLSLYKTINKCIRVALALLILLLCTAIFIAGYAGYDYLAERSKIVYVREHIEPLVVEKPHTIVEAVITAYTSSVDETDEDPFITASGSTVRQGTLACPSKYQFGTIVEINGNHYTCEDRMNKRYRQTERFDMWVESKQIAYAWGKQQLQVKVYISNN